MIGNLLTIFTQPVIKPVNYMWLSTGVEVTTKHLWRKKKIIQIYFWLFCYFWSKFSFNLKFCGFYYKIQTINLIFYDILRFGVTEHCRCQMASGLSLFITSYSPNTNTRCFLLQQLVVLLIQANCVFPPELLWFVHWTPLQTSRLQLRAVLIKRTARGRRKAV